MDCCEISPCYLMVDTDLLSSFITNIASCKICYSNVVVTHKLDEKQGFAHNISVKCCKDSCSWSKGFWTSKKIKTPKGRPPFDINMRSVIAFREIGKGHTAMQKFGGFMNMPSVLTQNSYAGLVTNIQKTYTKVAKASMLKAADEIRMEKLEDTYDTDNLVDIDISDKMMNKMQCYFGQTIRANTDSVYLMKKGIWAILWHCSEDDKDTPGTRHQFCPRGDDTWCSYWKASNSGSLETYKEKVGLPDAIKKILKPIFVDLTKDELLLKCVHGLTQNNNESINNVIWKRVPKDIYVGREVLEMGVASAVINYNQGLNGICNVYNELSMEVGKFTESFLTQSA